MTTYFDTNVLIAILDPAEPHHAWATAQFEESKERGPVVICDIVYSELSAGMATKEEVDTAIKELALERLPSDENALFRAGTAYRQYRERAGTKTNVLPDFLIGAAAAATGIPLVTANVKDYRNYFPEVNLIHP